MTAPIKKKRKAKDFVLAESFLLKKFSVFRYPFLMVDRIVDFSAGDKPSITSVKCVASNEPQFTGHFPDFPLMPGVLIAESINQSSEYLSILLAFVNNYRSEHNVNLDEDLVAMRDQLNTQDGVDRINQICKNTTGMLASHNLKFKEMVLPGDTLVVNSELYAQDAGGFCHFNVEAHVRNKLVCSGQIVNWRKMVEGVFKINY